MKKDTFLSAVIGIAIPVGLQSMLQSSFAMVDQLMVGRLGSTAVSAVEAAGRPAFIYSVLLGAVATIAGIMISQFGLSCWRLGRGSCTKRCKSCLPLSAIAAPDKGWLNPFGSQKPIL